MASARLVIERNLVRTLDAQVELRFYQMGVCCRICTRHSIRGRTVAHCALEPWLRAGVYLTIRNSNFGGRGSRPVGAREGIPCAR